MFAISQFDGKRVMLLLYECLYITQLTIKLVSFSIKQVYNPQSKFNQHQTHRQIDSGLLNSRYIGHDNLFVYYSNYTVCH